ncbi:MAG: hypothetical protein ACLPVO_12380 [Desulfomonilaceae bacterium]
MEEETESRVAERTREMVFKDFIQQFSLINNDKDLFPKKCRTCGKKYESLYHYIYDTEAKAQSMEDAGEIMGKSFTMIYRNCSCGNTLVVSVTDEILPSIKDFWKAVRRLAYKSNMPVKEIVTSFVDEWERQIRNHFNCVQRRTRF